LAENVVELDGVDVRREQTGAVIWLGIPLSADVLAEKLVIDGFRKPRLLLAAAVRVDH
jgi:hypothetical protein